MLFCGISFLKDTNNLIDMFANTICMVLMLAFSRVANVAKYEACQQSVVQF